MKQYLFRVEEGQPLVKTLQENISKVGIESGLVISLVGALKDFKLITIKQDSQQTPPEHFEKSFDRKCEVTGNGVIKDGRVHIHVVCGQEGGAALSGHLVEGTVTYFVDVGVLAG